MFMLANFSRFGCLPIHVSSRGMLKAVRKAYPSANMCAIG